MTTIQALKKARKLISNPKRWCQFREAQNARGLAVSADDSSAYKFCAAGAILKVAGRDSEEVLVSALKALMKSTRGVGVATYNDKPRRTHAQVLNIFDRAIAKLEKK